MLVRFYEKHKIVALQGSTLYVLQTYLADEQLHNSMKHVHRIHTRTSKLAAREEHTKIHKLQ